MTGHIMFFDTPAGFIKAITIQRKKGIYSQKPYFGMITESDEEDRNKKYSHNNKLLNITRTLKFEKISSPLLKK